MRKFKTWRDPYDEGFSLTRPKEIEIHDGLTVLVGCNGAGKTTLLLNIEDELKKAKVPCLRYDNLTDGGSHAIGAALYHGNFSTGASLWCASEGERISINIGGPSGEIRDFISTGKTRKDAEMEKWNAMFNDSPKKPDKPSKERWILMDAVDSGYSVDNVVDLKEVFRMILNTAEAEGVEMYIVVSANEYELAAGEACFDVNSGKYTEFSDYGEYRKFILNSRKKKDRRIEKQDSQRIHRRGRRE